MYCYEIGFFRFCKITQPYQYISTLAKYQIKEMNKFTDFVKESYVEMTEKVSWPKWDQLTQSTMIVLGATLFITLIVGIMDFVANGSMKFIYSLFK
jgi:preprotein translocase subunit SecE